MYGGPDLLLAAPMGRDAHGGTTAWSYEAGLLDENRLLAWTVVKEDRASHGRAFFGPDMTCGTVITTLNRADNVISKRFGNVGRMCPVVRRNET